MNTLERAAQIQQQLVEWRRDFHMYPELGFHEIRTSARIAKVLDQLGYRVRTSVGGTGVLAEIGSGGPVIALRVDMDALPLSEVNQVPYTSKHPGIMHACGHDVHSAVALGAATLLAKEGFPGTIRFLFQPSEEGSDSEGISGAQRMINDGALDGVDAAIGMHVDASVRVGNITLKTGPATAGVDALSGKIMGKGSHGARPNEGIDPIYLTAHVILAIQGVRSRRLHPFSPAVVSVCSVHGGQTHNVLPGHVELTGTIRYMEPAVQGLIHAEVERALSVSRSLGGDYQMKIELGPPPVVNDEGMVALVKEVGAGLLGSDKVLEPEPMMGGEDFAFMSALVPSAWFRLGCRIEDDIRFPHSSSFDVDERCLPIGVAMLVEAALRFLRCSKG